MGLALRSSGNAVAIMVPLCGERSKIHSVFVNMATVNDERERIWEIESRGESLREITLGMTPPGFTEKVPLTIKIPPDRLLAIFVGVKNTPPWSGVASARLEQLEVGKVFYLGHSITLDEYHRAIGC